MGNGKTHGMDAGVPPGPKDAGLAGGVTSANKNLGNKSVGSQKQPCPLKDKIKLVELVEVVIHKGKQTTQPVKGRKQYINLDDKFDPNKPHPEYGRCIRLKARVEWVSGDKSRSLAGEKVYWYSKADSNNRDRAKLKGEQKDGFGSPGSTKTKDASTTDKKGWTPVMQFYLSLYGGDKFEIFATENSNHTGGLKAGPYEVWRRMWYEVTEMKKKSGGKFELPNGVLTNVKKAYENIYIELVDTGLRHEGEFKDNLRFPEYFKWADKYCSASYVPWKVHYAVLHHAADKLEKTDFDGVKTNTYTMKNSFRPYDFDGAKWLISAEYTSQAENENRLISDFRGWKSFPTGNVTLIGTNPTRKIHIDFKNTGVDPTKNPQVARVRYYEADVNNGWGGSSLHLIICRGAFDEYYNNIVYAMSGTCIHEPGHSFGLVSMRETHSWETSDQAHKNHCKFEDCVMWFQGTSTRGHDFHTINKSDPGCHTYIRGLDMSRDKMNPIWKFPRGG